MTERQKGVLAISTTALLWGLPALFIHYIAAYLEPHTQNFWRYLSALFFLVAYGVYTRQLRFSVGRGLWRTAASATILFFYQTCFTNSLYRGMPAMISLLIQLALIVSVALSCLFFADERRLARSPLYIAGAAATILGAAGMVVFSPALAGSGGEPARENLLVAVTLVIGAAILWGCYSVSVKWCLQALPPFSVLINIELIATTLFLLAGLRFGRIGSIAHAPGSVIALVIGTGVVCIAVAHILYTGAIHRLGVVVCNTVILASPVVAAVCSRIFYHEQLAGLQIVSGAALLAGAAAAIQARRRFERPAPIPLEESEKTGQTEAVQY
jgi:drug/metabolite transporter (DMT)-like permease